MSSFLILLFVTYELLESPPRSFVSIRIINRKEDEYGFHIMLSISSNSNENSKGVLLTMLGYEDSIISENSTFYIFIRFKIYSQEAIQLSSKEEEILEIILPPDSNMKRIIIVYFLKPDLEVLKGSFDQIVLRKEDALWVQTWVG
ncbi:MAG: hypothetical protein QXR97_02295 [Thermoproteota archaeon]